MFYLATGLVTVYVFQEPSLLSSLQDNGLTDVVLHALLVKDVGFDGHIALMILLMCLFNLFVFQIACLILLFTRSTASLSMLGHVHL